MTNQEAVRILSEQRNKFMDEWVDFGGVNEAYNMAIQVLKEQEAWIEQIADYQQSITGSGMHELTEYEQGKWDGLQIAWNIISEGR